MTLNAMKTRVATVIIQTASGAYRADGVSDLSVLMSSRASLRGTRFFVQLGASSEPRSRPPPRPRHGQGTTRIARMSSNFLTQRRQDAEAQTKNLISVPLALGASFVLGHLALGIP